MKQFDMILTPICGRQVGGVTAIRERRMNIIAIEPDYAFEFSMIRIKGRDS
jgi:hypothetical protein